MEQKIAIIGAGVAGLTASHYLNRQEIKNTLYEKTAISGGLCSSFWIGGYYFDYGAHAAFSKDKEVRELMEKELKFTTFLSDTLNYKRGNWIKQPVQNNLAVLDKEEKIKIIKAFVERNDDGVYSNYAEWLDKKYGNYFSVNYPYLYTKKYWTVHPDKMETKWIGPRMYTPTLEEVLQGVFSEKTTNVHYSGTIRYPDEGGFGGFLSNISRNKDIRYQINIKEINPHENQIAFCNGQKIGYDRLISTIPLPELVKLMKDVPEPVRLAAENLNYTSLVLISLGIRKKNMIPQNKKLFYAYDLDIHPARVYATSEYAKTGAPEGCTALQAEVYFSKFNPLTVSLEEMKKKVINDYIKMGLIQQEDIEIEDVRFCEYANVLFTHDIYKNREIVHTFLERQQIVYAGRFGEWDYLWSDQSIISGKRAAEKIIGQLSGDAL